MANHCKFVSRIGLAALLVLLVSGSGWGAEQDEVEPADAVSPPLAGLADDQEVPVLEESVPVRTEIHTDAEAQAGYRFISVNRSGSRAAEYEYLHSNPVFAGKAHYLGPYTKFSLDGGYLNDNDYHGDLAYDYKGLYRLTLSTEALFHNLDHEQLFSPDFAFVNSANVSSQYLANDSNGTNVNGVRVEQDLARFRYKFAQAPIHLNLGYWRMIKEGTTQQIFADQAFEGSPNTIYSQTRRIDRQTHEGQFGVDSHLGLLDVIYDFRIREFRDHAATPADTQFIPRLDSTLALQRYGGFLEHNENPDSRFYAHTIRLHTSMSGGIVGAASYSYGRRENLSHLTDFTGADQAYSIVQNVAGDFTYTPCRTFSLAVKYRRQDVERNAPATLTALPGLVVTPSVGVRAPLDTLRDVVTATLSFRPTSLLTLKGEYRGDYLSRDNVDAWRRPGTTATMYFPGHSMTHTGTVSLLSRPVKGLRLNAEYSYSTADSPAYANGYQEKHQGTFLATYNASNRWGLCANTRVFNESNDALSIVAIDPSGSTPPGQLPHFSLPRERRGANSTLSVWVVPFGNVTVTGSYGLLRSSTDQAVLLASVNPGQSAPANYTSQAQIYGVNAAYHWDARLDLSLALQQVRSSSEFDPQSTSTLDTTGVSDLTRLKTVESSLAARADYRFTKNVSCALEYTFRDYDEKNSALFDGSVNSVMLTLVAQW